MSGENKRYWKTLAEKDGGPEFLRAAAEEMSSDPRQFRRRDFLKAAGFTLGVAAATGCSRAPVQRALPLLSQPEEMVPGRSLLYSTTCGACSAGCGVLARVRDGRPIKLEGNLQHPVSRGGLCATGQASILGLYDSERLQQPLKEGKKSSWANIDPEIQSELTKIRNERGAVRFLSGTLTSPTAHLAIQEFLNGFTDAKHVVYDPLSNSALLDAHEQTHGVREVPQFRFDKAEVIVSFDADFLGTWISPVEYTAGYRAGRDLETRRVSYHVQFEPRMSVTGSKADRRFAVAPGDLGFLLTHVARRVAGKAGVSFASASVLPESPPVDAAILDELADHLWQAPGRSLVVCGSNDQKHQVLANYVNHLLGNYGATIDLEKPSFQSQGSDRELESLLAELRDGKVRALFVHGVNPVFDLPGAEALSRDLTKVPFLVSFAQRLDETAVLARYTLPAPHYLETWTDAEPVAGVTTLFQPAIHPLGDTRSLIETVAVWSGMPATAYVLVRESWKKNIFPRQKKETDFEAFWERTLQDGFAEVEPVLSKAKPFDAQAVVPIQHAQPAEANSFALVLYPSVAMLDGRNAYNPWLHELPDPITKVTWDNCASIAPATAQKLGIAQGDVVRLATNDGKTVELPAYIQPGQHEETIAVALGYGSRLSSRFARVGPQWIDAMLSVGDNGRVGVNIAPLLKLGDGVLQYSASAVTLTRTGRQRELACTQTHNTLTVPKRLTPPGSGARPVVQETTLAAFLKDPHSGVEDHEEKEDLWPTDHPYAGPRWGMVIDQNACTGCSSCVVACQVENNIPVVGRDEIRRNREMHWLRIDRYYAETESGQIEVGYEPLMCQQCENAPCETVCPVLATVHSEDGLNQQVYNRCIGTRYCANNCPYKARRFNWFSYSHDDQLQNLVLNPDVAVRSRGVMEKCTFCVQRIQEAKIEAKRRGEKVGDGAVQTACQQSCPAQAIYFGDLNDPNSKVSKMMANPRRYRVLEELNVRPAVGYLTVVRNRPAEGGERSKEEHHG